MLYILLTGSLVAVALLALYERGKRQEAELKLALEERMTETLGRTLAQCRSRLEDAQREMQEAGLLGDPGPVSTLRKKVR